MVSEYYASGMEIVLVRKACRSQCFAGWCCTINHRLPTPMLNIGVPIEHYWIVCDGTEQIQGNLLMHTQITDSVLTMVLGFNTQGFFPWLSIGLL